MVASLKKQNLKLGFFRGADFSCSIGVTDWRIGLFLPEHGLETWIFGKGELPNIGRVGVTLERFKTIPLPFLGTLHLLYLYAIKAAKLEPDIIICNVGSALAGILLKILKPRTKLILDIRSIPVESRGIADMIWQRYFGIVFKVKFFDAISVITNGMLDDLDNQHHFKERVPTVVWESGYDHEIFDPTINGADLREKFKLQDKLILMFHGSLSPSRGLYESVQSIQILRNRGFDDIVLILIGNGTAQSDLCQLVKALGVENQVIFLPPVTHHEIPKLIAAADLGIDPLPDHSWWRNQSALKVFEYLAMGKPVIATDIPCHQNISEAVIRVSNNEPATLAKAILQFKESSLSEKSHLKEIALQDSQRQSWKARAEVLANFIKNEVLAGNR